MKSVSLLLRLEHITRHFDESATSQKLELLRLLEKRRFQNPDHVFRFHDTLCFLRAYPDNHEIL